MQLRKIFNHLNSSPCYLLLALNGWFAICYEFLFHNNHITWLKLYGFESWTVANNWLEAIFLLISFILLLITICLSIIEILLKIRFPKTFLTENKFIMFFKTIGVVFLLSLFIYICIL